MYLPKAEQFALKQFWIAVELGYDDHFEESETIGLAVAILILIIGIPISLATGVIGAKCSDISKTSGVGRYTVASIFAVLPFAAGTYMTFSYWWIANRLQTVDNNMTHVKPDLRAISS